jgi:hypothetical protein
MTGIVKPARDESRGTGMSSSQSGADIEEDTAGEVTKPPIQGFTMPGMSLEEQV